MFRFKSFKTNGSVINFKDSSLSLESLNSFLANLENLSLNSEIEFNVENLDGTIANYKLINDGTIKAYKDNKSIVENDFYRLVKNNFYLELTPQIMQARIVQYNSQIRETISKLSIPISPDLVNKIAEAKNTIESVKNSIESSLSEEQKDKYSRLTELNSRLNSIQNQIDSFQGSKKSKEDITTNIKKYNTDKSTIKQMMESVGLLIKTRDELKQKVLSYNHLIQDADKVNQLKQQKMQFQNSQLFTKSQSAINSSEDDSARSNSKFKLKLSIIPILLFLNIAISIVGFLYSYDFNVLVVAVVSTVILMTAYIVSKFFSDSLEDLNEDSSRAEVIDIKQESNPLAKEDPNAQLFINSAWVNALNNELNAVEQNIQKNLNGKDYESIKNELQQIENLIVQEEKKLTDLSANSITSDEYYKKRREADILKIERENLEFGLKIDSNLTEQRISTEKTLKELLDIQTFASKLSMGFPVFLVKTSEIQHTSIDLLNQIVLVLSN